MTAIASGTSADPRTNVRADARVGARGDEKARIIALLQDASLELSSRDPTEIDACVPLLAPGTEVYISIPPGQTYHGSVALAARLKRAGFRPVPHIAARQIARREALEDYLARAAGEGGVDSALVIAGDLDRACGPFDSSLALLDTGLFERHGIVNIGVAGHPEGHPRVATAFLDTALADKKRVATQHGLSLRVVTQFCFEAKPVLTWAARQQSLQLPLRVGLAGPAGLTRLLRFAALCGVGNSVRALKSRPGAMARLMTEAGPEAVLRELADQADIRLAGVHFFCFGGLVHTARWLQAMRQGRFELAADGGIQVGARG
jgi:methylenetetrahydrofolate reductase (NADPH)